MSPTQCSTTEVNVVVSDGYGRSASTKAAEQQGRATQSISADIMFECDMKTTTTQKYFLANDNRAAACWCARDAGSSDHLIASTTLTLAQAERKPVFVVGTDTDLLVMLKYRSSTDMDIHCRVIETLLPAT